VIADGSVLRRPGRREQGESEDSQHERLASFEDQRPPLFHDRVHESHDADEAGELGHADPGGPIAELTLQRRCRDDRQDREVDPRDQEDEQTPGNRDEQHERRAGNGTAGCDRGSSRESQQRQRLATVGPPAGEYP